MPCLDYIGDLPARNKGESLMFARSKGCPRKGTAYLSPAFQRWVADSYERVPQGRHMPRLRLSQGPYVVPSGTQNGNHIPPSVKTLGLDMLSALRTGSCVGQRSVAWAANSPEKNPGDSVPSVPPW